VTQAAAVLALAVAFAFPSQDGSRLLATGDLARPSTLRTALCTGGQRLAVEFERRQPEGKDSTGRQSSSNFAGTAGAVFRVIGAKANPDASCLIADEAFLAGTTPVPLRRPPQDARCSKAQYPSIQAAKSRPVVACWPIGLSPQGIQVAIVEFSRRLSDALASLVVTDGERRLYVDYPAKFNGPGADLWRADDGGEIHAEGFEVVCLLKRGSAYFLAVDWRGAEGNALSLHIAETGNQFKEVRTDSWYRAPM
jgi:hypothetical protein